MYEGCWLDQVNSDLRFCRDSLFSFERVERCVLFGGLFFDWSQKLFDIAEIETDADELVRLAEDDLNYRTS